MNRFTPVVLAEGLDEPMTFQAMEDGRVYFIERKGAFKMYNPVTQLVDSIAALEVNTKYTSAEGNVREAEEGLVGFIMDPDFEQNNWVYFLYAYPAEAKHVLSRFDLIDNELITDSEIVLLDFPVQRETCCHTGGGMTFDEDGNLYVTIGNNTGNYRSAQTDERPGRESWDDQRGAANTNDLRGKIIRIHPEDDGTYSIPDGNLFPEGTADTKPEIFAMGLRNPWRISLDHRGWVYWGEVGPDAREDTEIGPMGYDEFNQAREAGFFGWPYFVGDNQAFPVYDYENDIPLEVKDPENPTNLSPNNTGLTELPPVQEPFIWYPYGASEVFPSLKSGSRSAVGGPFFYKRDFEDAERSFPDYYEGKWFIADFTRNWILAVTLDENGDYVSMEPFLPDYFPASPIDMNFGPNGDLYVLEYGSGWFQGNPNSRLVRIEYNAGNRSPVAQVHAEPRGGIPPFEVSLSSDGTIDYDGDELSYEWEVSSDHGSDFFSGSHPTVQMDNEGEYQVTLTVTDPDGLSDRQTVEIISGNTPADVQVDITSENQSFFFPDTPFSYTVSVDDAEDGSLSGGDISPADVGFQIEFVSEGFDLKNLNNTDYGANLSVGDIAARHLMEANFCFSCHQVDVPSVGPMYTEVAEQYENRSDARTYIADKIRNGSSGVWGEIAMPPHASLSNHDAGQIADYILSAGGDNTTPDVPLQGDFSSHIGADVQEEYGSYILRAVYEDRGRQGVVPLTSQDYHVLMSNRRPVHTADVYENVDIQQARSGAKQMVAKKGGYVGYEQI
ncbi:MAG: PQQ-dependent sugar dehydrogenase, partial [Balneolaceae bacterium]